MRGVFLLMGKGALRSRLWGMGGLPSSPVRPLAWKEPALEPPLSGRMDEGTHP